MSRLTAAVVALITAMAVFLTVFFVGMKTKYPPIVDAVRRMNRATFNPRQLPTAGTPGAFASKVKHVGRTSGMAYETPVGVVATDDGFAIALPYGTRADWVKNVLAAGTATIVTEGETHRVDRPEIVPTEAVRRFFPPFDQRFLLVLVDECLLVRTAKAGADAGA